MLILPGSLALSSFRQNRLLRSLQALLPSVKAVEARFLHLVDGEVAGGDDIAIARAPTGMMRGAS